MTTATTTLPQWLTTKQVLKMLGISRQTLWLWIGSGYFPEGRQFNPTGTRLRWPEEQVTAWMDSRPVGRGCSTQRGTLPTVADETAAPPRPVLLPKSMRGT
jgi:predicted DNA-binding transcriptional regulator AlpA